MLFEGTIGPDSKGDIGLDLIRLQKGLCTYNILGSMIRSWLYNSQFNLSVN